MVKENTMRQTEIGLLPEDWEVVQLADILKFGSGRDYKHLKKGDIPVYGTGGLMTYVDEFLYDGNSVGIGRKGTIDKPVFLTGKFWTVDTLFYTHSFQKTTPKYVYYRFGRIPWKEYNEASGVPSLNKNTLEQIHIPLPPLPEQEAIAGALSDADAWIESLEQLIAKKRLIKQGAMQELLSPKEDWEVKKLGELFDITAGGDLVKYDWSDIYSDVFKYDVYSNSLSNKGLYCFSSEFNSDENCITVTARGTVGYAVPRFSKFVAIGRLLCLKPKLALDIRFVSEFINNKIAFANESTGVPQLTAPQISTYEIIIPSLTEQTRIATILSDMDAELEALEGQLGKARKVKQGMMQELLTGRVRLV